MTYGWAGTSLEIDLSQGKIERKPIDHQLYETYLGGKGIAAKLLWDRVPPEVEPFSPDNLLVFAAGILTGTPCPSANRVTIGYKSPLTNFTYYSHMGGFWAADLKHAGYDTIVVSGKSPSPVYIWINDDNVEIRDASHLWGKDTVETQRLIREELKNNSVQTICIGPAGENKVYVASIEHSGTGNSASRAGPGAVMGDKNLKAIVIHGTKDINIARPSEFMELCELVLKKAEGIRHQFETQNWCERIGRGLDTAWFGNADEMPPGVGFENHRKTMEEFLNKFLIRQTSCYNCPARCQAWLALDEERYYYPRCEAFCFSLTCKVPDEAFSLKCCNLCVKYGLDIKSTGRILGFAIDLYQKGILTKEDTDGMQLEYGNPAVAFSLIEKIAHRRGIGNILANGTCEAAHKIGRGAEQHTYLVKKMDKSPDYCTLNPTGVLMYATTDLFETHGITLFASSLRYMGLVGKERDAYIKGGWWLYPDEWEEYLDIDYSVDYDGVADFACYGENAKVLTDMVGLCWWWTGFTTHTAIKIDTIIGLLSRATGIDINKAKAMEAAQRTRTLIQANNVRLGMRRKDDAVPEKMFNRGATPREKALGLVKLDRNKFDKALDKYYAIRGWNNDGIPSKETLDKLGLDGVRRNLEQRGIL